MQLKIGESFDSFRMLRENHAYYVIKKKYDSRLIYHGYQECLRYGMAFRDKRVMIAGD